MFKFFAILWDFTDQAHGALADQLSGDPRSFGAEWVTVLDRPGTRVLCTDARQSASRAVLLEGGCGVVLGTIFPWPEEGTVPKPVASFRSDETRHIVESQGRALTSSYWGRYVGIVCSFDNYKRWVIRDPSGSFSCFHITFRGLHLFFSSADQCHVLERLPLTLDWQYVAATLTFGTPDSRRTGLKEVTRLFAGECLEVSPRGQHMHKWYWQPSDVLAAREVDSEVAAQRQIRVVTTQCVHAWASCFSHTLLALSGGLDSSIVASCLASAADRCSVLAANQYYDLGANSDERRFAHLTAQATGIPLIELREDPRVGAQSVLQDPLHPAPFDFFSISASGAPIRRLALEHGVEALFTGGGGDEVFFRSAPRHACSDYIRRHGLRPRAFTYAMHRARLCNGSVWWVLYKSFRDAYSADPLASMFDVRQKLRPSELISRGAAELAASAQFGVHPWIASRKRIPPGKAHQIFLLTFSRDTNVLFSGPSDPDQVDPLFSQPLIELCLRIPTTLLASDGWDRSMARKAFEGELPREVIWRREKCVRDQYLTHYVSHNAKYIAEIVLDGILAKQGILNRSGMEAYLNGKVAKGLGAATDVCAITATEIWLNQWIKVGANASPLIMPSSDAMGSRGAVALLRFDPVKFG